MSSFTDELEQLLQKLFAPLTTALTDPNGFSSLLSELGWSLDPSFVSNAGAGATLNTLFGTIVTDVNTLVGGDMSVVPNLVTAIQGLTSSDATLPSPLNGGAGFWSTFGNELYQYLIYVYLRDNVPVAFGALRFAGVLTAVQQPAATGPPPRTPYLAMGVDWSQLKTMVQNPSKLGDTLWNWTSGFDHLDFLDVISDVFAMLPLYRAFAGSPSVTQASTSLLQLFWNPATLPASGYEQLSTAPQYFTNGGTPFLPGGKVSLIALPIPATDKGSPPPTGLAVFPLITGSLGQSFSVADNVVVTFNGGIDSAPVAAEIRPGGNTTLVNLGGNATTIDAEARIDAQVNSPGWILFGDASSSYFSIIQAHARVQLNGPLNDITFKGEGGIDHAELVVDFSDADSFVSTFLGNSTEKFDFGGTLLYSSKSGFGFNGQTNLQITLPAHQTLFGAITISGITLGINGLQDRTSIPIGLSGDVSLGPLAATIDNIGLIVELVESPGHDGGFGDIDPQFAFKPPDGLGASLDLGPVSGGGYLDYDDSKHEYSGIMAASFDFPLAAFDIVLIGILDTQLPDGTKEYSFLIIITIDFPPMQLGFGFTLNGVGGLAGINRSMVIDALQTAVHNGTVDDILFPADPIANAIDIISTVSAIFPAADGRYTFGPMLDLGWGTPGLIDAQMGLIIEVPDPIRLAILGILQLGLPSLEVPDDLLLVDINVDVVGTIDFDKRQMGIDASLYDSRIVEFSLAGDFLLRLDWGDQPSFVLSMGGFNPHFQPPVGIPPLHRLSISIGTGSIGIALSTYLAVTSNTFQFGAHLDAHASAGGFSIHGYLGFDCLFIFHPFSFIIDMQAGVDVLSGSSVLFQVSLSLTLSGPRPWQGQGSASFNILFVSISVGVNFSIGDPAQADPIPQVAVLPLLQAALQDVKSWSAQLPTGLQQSITLATPPGSTQQVIVHPMGLLQVDERIVPLGFPINKFGNDAPSDGSTFSIIDPVSVNGTNLVDGSEVNDISDYFARAQFVQMSDGDKLAAQSFEQFKAGKLVGSTSTLTVAPVVQQEQYVTYIVDDPEVPAPIFSLTYQPTADQQLVWLNQSAASFAPSRRTGTSKYVVPGTASPVLTADASYVVVNTIDLSINSAVSPASGTTQAQAAANLNQYVTKNPSASGNLEVLALYEAAA